MFTGVLQLTIRMDQNHSLKDKRRFIQSILSRTRNKYQVAVAEVDHLERWDMAGIGFAYVSNSYTLVREIMLEIIPWIEMQWDVEILESDIQVY
jgi:hypothetical protein